MIEIIKKLAELRDLGMLKKAEFNTQKAELLNKDKHILGSPDENISMYLYR